MPRFSAHALANHHLRASASPRETPSVTPSAALPSVTFSTLSDLEACARDHRQQGAQLRAAKFIVTASKHEAWANAIDAAVAKLSGK